MRPMRAVSCAVALVLCLWAPVAHPEGPHFVSQQAVNFLLLLAPPPSPRDPRTTAELDELRRMRATRSVERVKLAKADVEETVFRLMTVLDRPLTPEQLPKTTAFFKKLTEDVEFPTQVAKKGFARPRPYAVASDLEPVCPLSDSGAYPSGHTTVGYYMGVVLAAMVPEKREAIFARMQEYAESRLYCGVHYRSDIEAGRIAGTALAALAMNNPDFQREFVVARGELRAVLGY